MQFYLAIGGFVMKYKVFVDGQEGTTGLKIYDYLSVRVMKLLYICDKTDALPQILHITFMLERICGEIRLPTNEFDENPIHDVKMITINELTKYGFSELFQDIVEKGFPSAGNYMGMKSAIGL
jgi:hypothetical protein